MANVSRTPDSHNGTDPGHGGDTKHRGAREDCPAPGCVDSHATHRVILDNPDPDGRPDKRPCGCPREFDHFWNEDEYMQNDDMVEAGAANLVNHYAHLPEEIKDHWRHRARQVLSAALAGCTVDPAATETDGDAALRMARGRQWLAHRGNAYLPAWDDLTVVEQEQAEQEARYWIQAAVNTGVKIVPAGLTVVALPEPDGTSIEGDPLWSAHVDYEETIFACVDADDGQPTVEGPFAGPWSADTAEMFGLRLLAAAREARRLAGGEQHV